MAFPVHAAYATLAATALVLGLAAPAQATPMECINVATALIADSLTLTTILADGAVGLRVTTNAPTDGAMLAVVIVPSACQVDLGEGGPLDDLHNQASSVGIPLPSYPAIP